MEAFLHQARECPGVRYPEPDAWQFSIKAFTVGTAYRFFRSYTHELSKVIYVAVKTGR